MASKRILKLIFLPFAKNLDNFFGEKFLGFQNLLMEEEADGFAAKP